jgi:DNA-binding Xre family transcriptional regulator
MIVVRLREAMEQHRRRTGSRITYRQLAQMTGVSESTLQSISARRHYNTTLDTVDRIAVSLACPLADLLEHIPLPQAGPAASSPPATDREGNSGHQD